MTVQIWKCAEGKAMRVWGATTPTKEQQAASPLLYCEEHARLCRHSFVKVTSTPYVEYRQGENVLDTRN